MKKNLHLLMAAILLLAFTSICSAQEKSYKEFMKERKEMQKFTKDQAKEKASKDARKAAKQLQKEGWKVAPGSLPMDKQLDRLYEMQYEIDLETGFPKFIKGEAMSTGGNYDAAKMQAVNLAKIELAGNISTEVGALIDSRVENNQLDPEEAVSATESVMAAKSLIQQKIGRTIMALEIYRDLKNKNKEVRVIVMYNSDMAKAAAKDAIREEMTKKSDKLAGQLDEILGF